MSQVTRSISIWLRSVNRQKVAIAASFQQLLLPPKLALSSDRFRKAEATPTPWLCSTNSRHRFG
ncbi:hypothetical protein [Chamaesiphon sp. OTE_20_metabat_361]|uniref:hypothetical protein n=1 Tax=Chamaesiphon sp. OTE_20_metabat_361 TaxID=2964689 RepID=UPI00286B64D9|nr:hypothetical protein [Chamaesiphon sp. OTE_20_metabat_361]